MSEGGAFGNMRVDKRTAEQADCQAENWETVARELGAVVHAMLDEYKEACYRSAHHYEALAALTTLNELSSLSNPSSPLPHERASHHPD